MIRMDCMPLIAEEKYLGLDKKGMLNLLNDLSEKDKFAPVEWEKRGLGAPKPAKCTSMNQIINNMIDAMIFALHTDDENETMKQTIVSLLYTQDLFDFESEEIEFLWAWFDVLVSIVNVDIHNELNKCLYGEFSGFI